MKKTLKVLLFTTAVFTHLTSIQRLSAQGYEIHNAVGFTKIDKFLNDLTGSLEITETESLEVTETEKQNTEKKVLEIINHTTNEEYKGLGIWYAVADKTEDLSNFLSGKNAVKNVF